MNSKCTVTISRQGERPSRFEGTILKESSSHYLVKYQQEDINGDGAEWFPKVSRAVTTIKHES